MIRHALAESREEFEKKAIHDQFRPLVEKGKKKTEKLAQKLIDKIGAVDLVVTSPYLRSRQTAEIIQKIWGGKLIEAPELVPHSPPEAFLRWLRGHSRTCQRVVVVGHEPHLSGFICFLLTGSASHRFLELKKTGICALKFESFQELHPAKVQLSWVLTPKVFLD